MSKYTTGIGVSSYMDRREIMKTINDLEYEMNNPYNDGYTGSAMKKQLIKIKEAATRALIDAPVYAGEEEW